MQLLLTYSGTVLGDIGLNPFVHAIAEKLASLPVKLCLVMPDGMQLGDLSAPLKLHAKEKKVLMDLAAGDVGFIAADFVEGRCDIEGSMREVMAAAIALLPNNPALDAKASWFGHIIDRFISAARHSIERDAKQIQFHYDLSDEFYQLWLDPRRVYSCAYYRAPHLTLAQAQEAKLDLICRKLKLRPGERYLDVGSGWGALLLWAAENYGVDATGITLSKNQYAYVNKLIERKGLSGRVRVHLLDYRELNPAQPFDKISSVGMFEHVGRANMTRYFAQLKALLRPGGLILNHGITAATPDNPMIGHGMGDFIERYIFPGGELCHIGHVLAHMTDGGIEPLDVENLRPHYARTLWAWSDSLEQQLDAAAIVLPGERGQRGIKAYRIYLAGCALAFEQGWVSLHQIVGQHLATGRSDELDMPRDQAYPWRRDYIYS